MKVKIRTKDFRFYMPVPIAVIQVVIRFIPGSAFDKIRENIPGPYCSLITKEYISMIFKECVDILKENRGLEIVHVETADGTFVSVKI